MRLAPFPGGQTAFHSSSADIVGYGGRAGPGKTTALLLDPLRFIGKPGHYRYLLLRRQAMAASEAGGLADKAEALYSQIGATPRRGQEKDFRMTYTDPDTSKEVEVKGAGFTFDQGRTSSLRIQIAWLPKLADVFKWQGAELDGIGIDEAAHFSLEQVFYMITRLRKSSPENVYRPYMRLTFNPEPDGWLRDLVDWWIRPDGIADADWHEEGGGAVGAKWTQTEDGWRSGRGGVVRYFISSEDAGEDGEAPFIWGDSLEELRRRYPRRTPRSFTFIPGSKSDNPAIDWEEYEGNLDVQPKHVRDQLLGGNWNSRPPTPGQIYRVPDRCLFEDDDPRFLAFLRHQAGNLTQLGAWDYGVSAAGLCWCGGLIEPGVHPILWITHALDLTGSKGFEAGQRRMREGSDLPEFHVERFNWQTDSGDPSGEAENASESWTTTLRAAGVPLVPVYHLHDDQHRKLYFNSKAGFEFTVDLTQRLMDQGRIRIRASLRQYLRALRNYHRAIPEGTPQDSWTIHHSKPVKNWASHFGDTARYLTAFFWVTIETEKAQRAERRPRQGPPPKPSPGRLAREAIRSMR